MRRWHHAPVPGLSVLPGLRGGRFSQKTFDNTTGDNDIGASTCTDCVNGTYADSPGHRYLQSVRHGYYSLNFNKPAPVGVGFYQPDQGKARA